MGDVKLYTPRSSVALPLCQANCSFYIYNYTVPLQINSPGNNISHLKSGICEITHTQDSHTPTANLKFSCNVPQISLRRS